MQEQIYINGVLMDQASGKPASLVFQSPFFTDIDNIVSNRTNSVDFPATENNLAAIDNAHIPEGMSKFAYRKHRVLYHRDGVQIFSGYATLLSITNTAIKFTFTWGNVSSFQQMLDLKLRDLQTDNAADYVAWNNINIAVNTHFPTNLSWGGYGYINGIMTKLGHEHPVLKVSDIMSRISSVTGVTIQSPSLFNSLAIPLVTKKANKKSIEEGALHITYGSTYRLHPAQSQYTTGSLMIALLPTAADQDLKGMHKGNGIYDVSGIDRISVTIKQGSKIRVTTTSDSVPLLAGMSVFATLEDGSQNRLLSSIGMSLLSHTGNDWIYEQTRDETRTIDVSAYTYLVFALAVLPSACSSVGAAVPFPNIDFTAVCDPDEEQDVDFGGLFPLYANLPDWTASQLLKNLMKIAAVFPVCDSENTIRFLSIDSLYTNRANALDWTDKLILKNGMPDEQSPTFGSYAQKNLCKYAEDDSVKGDYNGALDISNETLDKEAELIALDFAGTDTDAENNPVIRSYRVNGDATGVDYEEVTPRILFLSDTRKVDFSRIAWNNLLAKEYYLYQATVNYPHVIKAKVLIDVLDLHTLDLSVPVYSHALGHYYAISKLTTKDEYTADVELLQLGQKASTSTTLPTSANPTEDLVVLRSAAGGYYATIPSLSSSELGQINSSDSYRICIIRYGYTRRGLWFQYTDSRGDRIYSHSERDRTYKRLRKGLTWRIIGEEILMRGSIHAHSQINVSHYYDNATLVTRMGENYPLTLPKMRPKHSNNRSTVIGSSGRISNKSTNGLSELYIALYRRESGHWVCVSNKVQVRGRNSTKTKLWEFDEGNIVTVV